MDCFVEIDSLRVPLIYYLGTDGLDGVGAELDPEHLPDPEHGGLVKTSAHGQDQWDTDVNGDVSGRACRDMSNNF